ncbi:putative dehydrogenase [Lachnospiraceae bacterium PF1-21]
MKQVKFAIIGTSVITKKFLEVASSVPEFTLTAVYSRDLQKAKDFGASYGVTAFYDSLEALAADQEIDAVYIASPNSCHAAQTIQMMKAGKHVLCEKPIASNEAEVKEMEKVAKENGVVLLEAMRSVHDPAFLEIKEHLKKLGTLRYASLQFCQYSSKYDAFKVGADCNIFNPVYSAGALMDIGIYCIEAMLALFGEPLLVTGMGTFLRGGIDGAGAILAKYEEMIVELTYSKITGSQLPSQIQGEKGVMYISKIAEPNEVRIVYNDGAEEVIDLPVCKNNMVYELETFIKAVKGQKDADEFAQLSWEAIRITDEVRRQIGLTFPADQKIGENAYED